MAYDTTKMAKKQLTTKTNYITDIEKPKKLLILWRQEIGWLKRTEKN